jgi:acyl-CoA synthetase (AMP-forming)/AMP-acid ligase II
LGFQSLVSKTCAGTNTSNTFSESKKNDQRLLSIDRRLPEVDKWIKIGKSGYIDRSGFLFINDNKETIC